MKHKYLSLLALPLIVCSLSACNKENIKPEELKIPYASLSATTDYFQTFKGNDGQSSVDVSGQKTRLDMFVELDGRMKLAQSQPITAAELKNMYANANNPFVNPDLNAAKTKQLRDKTAASFSVSEAEKVRTTFEGYFDKIATISRSYNVAAADGMAGIYTSATGAKYLVDEKGIEWGQIASKSLLGAVMFDQIVNGYLGDAKQAVDNTQLVTGTNYTQLEHHWDEAYGYLTSNSIYPKIKPDGKKDERALGSYAYQDISAEEAAKKTSELYLAFLRGRAAVVNKDDATRKQQIAFIRTTLEKTLAKVTISYLKKTQDAIAANNFPDAVHSFAEGAGFLYSLRFAHNAKINAAISDQLLTELLGGPKGFYSLTGAKLSSVRNQIAAAYGIDANATTTH